MTEAQRDSDDANMGTVDCDEGHGVVATFACFFLWQRACSRCGQKHVVKAVETPLLQAFRTLALTVDDVVRFDNKIHDVRSTFDHTKSRAQKFGIAGSSNGAKKA